MERQQLPPTGAGDGLISRPDLSMGSDALYEFSHAAGHDLRTPLHGILWFIRVLLERGSAGIQEQEVRHLQRIREAAGDMERIIVSLVTLADAYSLPIQKEPLDLSALCVEIATELDASDSGTRADWQISPGLRLSGDRQLLRMAMRALLHNALKFSAGQNHPSVRVGMTSDAGRRTLFVQDEGIGFDLADPGQLFRPFARLNDRDRFPGSGLGLALVHQVMLRHGWQVWAEGAPGAGSTFFVAID